MTISTITPTTAKGEALHAHLLDVQPLEQHGDPIESAAYADVADTIAVLVCEWEAAGAGDVRPRRFMAGPTYDPVYVSDPTGDAWSEAVESGEAADIVGALIEPGETLDMYTDSVLSELAQRAANDAYADLNEYLAGVDKGEFWEDFYAMWGTEF